MVCSDVAGTELSNLHVLGMEFLFPLFRVCHGLLDDAIELQLSLFEGHGRARVGGSFLLQLRYLERALFDLTPCGTGLCLRGGMCC